MNVAQLIRLLQDMPQDATVKTWDAFDACPTDCVAVSVHHKVVVFIAAEDQKIGDDC